MERIEEVGEDPIRKYTDSENSALTNNLKEVTEQVRKVDSKQQDYSFRLVCQWHEKFFSGVRDHAGRPRSDDYGEEYLNFGPHRSVARADVIQGLDEHDKKARNLFDQLVSHQNQVDQLGFVQEIIEVALYLHADLIRIHPFRDGNGRIGRLIITYCLCRFNLPPVAFEIPKEEYIQSLNHYYQRRDRMPLFDLYLRLYKNQLTDAI